MKPMFALLLALAVSSCATDSTQSALEKVSSEHDPENLQLDPGYNDYVERTHLSDGTEVGLVSLGDGSSAKYWFRSHHLTGDYGGAWFEFSDGKRVYMSGGFCCEVQLPDEQLTSLASLRAFIAERDGISP